MWRLNASCLWFDEIFSVHAARHSWPELFRFAAADIIHPPLFYALLKIWIGLGGQSVLWLRLLPLIFALLTVGPFYFLARDLKLKPAAINFSVLLMAVSGFMIKYAQEVRMYSLLLFLSVTSIWLFFRFVNTESSQHARIIAVVICNLLLVYAHYYGWLLVVAELVVVLWWYRKRLASFAIGVAALLVSYVPWIYAVAVYREPGKGLAQNIGWITRPKFSDVFEYFVQLSKPFLFSQSTLDRSEAFVSGSFVLLLLVIAIVLLYLRKVRANSSRHVEDVLLVLLIVPLILAVALSWLLPYSIWGTRHLIACATPFFLLAGIAIESLRPYWAKAAILIVIGCVMTLAGAIYLIRPAPKLSWCAWDKLLSRIPASVDTPALPVYSFEDLVAYHLWFATSETPTPHLQIKVVKGLAGVLEDPAFFLPRRFNEIERVTPEEISGEHLWIAFRARRWDENAAPIRHVKSLGYTTQTVLSATAQGEQVFLVELMRPSASQRESTDR